MARDAPDPKRRHDSLQRLLVIRGSGRLRHDDSSFRDHLVYPKDLADWARKNDSLGKLKAAAEAARAKGMRRMRCEGGQACPQAGYWFTTAQSNSRRHFEAGTVMPVFRQSPWGATIWYWDEDQTAGS